MKKLVFSLIILCILSICFELIARAYYYNKPVWSSLASVQLFSDIRRLVVKPRTNRPDNSNHYTIRINLPKQVNDSIAAETARANSSIYQPWSEFRFVDVKGNYVNVFDQVRRSMPDTGKSEVWFLGGSTMFGFNVTDKETIPSAFARMTGMKVVNYGTPYYYSYQELIFLADKLFKGARPHTVIMLDGLNDCYAPYASITRSPFNRPRVEQFLHPEKYKYSEEFSYYEFPDSSKFNDQCETIFRNYLENIEAVKKLSDLYGFKLYCFWQPVPYFNYPGKANDPICAKRPLPQFEYIYPKVKEVKRNYLYYLGDMLQDAQLPFVDSAHYSPNMNEVIAKRMSSCITKTSELIAFKQ